MTIKNKSVLLTQADATLPDNTTNLIQPSDVRDMDKDSVDSLLGVNDNLNDLENKATARTNLDVYSTTEVDGQLSGVVAGSSPKASSVVATFTDGNIALSGLQTIDGVLLVDNNRVIVTSQTDPIENGIYDAHVGAWTRSTDFDGTPSNEVRDGVYSKPYEGTDNKGATFMVISSGSAINVGVDPITFDRQAGVGFGTTSGTATEGDDSRVLAGVTHRADMVNPHDTNLGNLGNSTLNTGDEIITTDTDGKPQESGVKIEDAPVGGSGFTFLPYASAPVDPVAGFAWIQDIDANTKSFNFFDGIDTFSVEMTK